VWDKQLEQDMLAHLLTPCLRRTSAEWGRFVAAHPTFFAAAPLLLAVLLGAGLSRSRAEGSPQTLFGPTHGLARLEAALARNLFPSERSRRTLYSELYTAGRWARLLLLTKTPETDVLKPEVRRSVLKLHSHLVSTVVPTDPRDVSANCTFRDLCTRALDNSCSRDAVLQLLTELDSDGETTGSHPLTLTFPKAHLLNGRSVFLGHQLGGVKTGSRGRLRSARAAQFTLYIRAGPARLSARWESTFRKTVRALQRQHPELVLFPLTWTSLRRDLAAVPRMSRAALLACVCTAFVLGAALAWDTPCLGALGMLSAVLAMLASAGLLNLAGSTFNSTLLLVPLLVLGEHHAGRVHQMLQNGVH